MWGHKCYRNFFYSNRETCPARQGENYCPSNQAWPQLGVKVQGAEFVLERLSQCLKWRELVPWPWMGKVDNWKFSSVLLQETLRVEYNVKLNIAESGLNRGLNFRSWPRQIKMRMRTGLHGFDWSLAGKEWHRNAFFSNFRRQRMDIQHAMSKNTKISGAGILCWTLEHDKPLRGRKL